MAMAMQCNQNLRKSRCQVNSDSYVLGNVFIYTEPGPGQCMHALSIALIVFR